MPRKINANWNRWILSSCRDFFYTRRQNIRLIFEGEPVTKDASERAEFRFNGPIIKQLDYNQYDLTVLINILLTTPLNNDTDRIQVLTGIFYSAFEPIIPIHRYGNTIVDDDSYLACMRIDPTALEPIRINDYGQSNPDIAARQATVESQYGVRLLGDL